MMRALALLLVLLGGCTFGGKAPPVYHCSVEEPRCPAGLGCVSGWCVAPGKLEAGADLAGGGDAASDRGVEPRDATADRGADKKRPPDQRPIDQNLVANGCAATVPVADRQAFPLQVMFGCAGKVTYPSRGSLCATGWSVCTSSQWMNLRKSMTPAAHYWIDDSLKWASGAVWDGGASQCYVGGAATGTCPTGSPMRVCKGAPATKVTDGKGNTCFWTGCGYAAPTPSQYFGGCNDPGDGSNLTAGTLCCK